MTAQEKANELIKFFDSIQFDHNKNIAYTFDHFTIDRRKICVLRFIDEMLDVIDCTSLQYDYWNQVKKEIENI